MEPILTGGALLVDRCRWSSSLPYVPVGFPFAATFGKFISFIKQRIPRSGYLHK